MAAFVMGRRESTEMAGLAFEQFAGGAFCLLTALPLGGLVGNEGEMPADGGRMPAACGVGDFSGVSRLAQMPFCDNPLAIFELEGQAKRAFESSGTVTEAARHYESR